MALSEENAMSSTVCSEFQEYARQLDEVNERRERIVKASRDVTMQSKKVIFELLRSNPGSASGDGKQAEKILEAVRSSHLSRVAKEVNGTDYWKFKRSYSPGVQEYVEAAALLHYFQHKDLLKLHQLNESLASVEDAAGHPFFVTLEDYLLGLTDTTGELMRHAVSSVGRCQQDVAGPVCTFLRALHEGFSCLPRTAELGREMSRKLEVMLQSLTKVEHASYMLKVRGSEYPQDILASQLERDGPEAAGD